MSTAGTARAMRVRSQVHTNSNFFVYYHDTSIGIAMYLTLCAMLLRCLAMRLAGWCVCDVRWIAGGMCDPELLNTCTGTIYLPH